VHLLAFYSSPAHLALSSLPARRSSDLGCVAYVVLSETFPGYASLGILFFFSFALLSGFRAWRTARNLEASKDLESITALHWKERSEEHTSELQSRENLVCRLLLEKKKH